MFERPWTGACVTSVNYHTQILGDDCWPRTVLQLLSPNAEREREKVFQLMGDQATPMLWISGSGGNKGPRV